MVLRHYWLLRLLLLPFWGGHCTVWCHVLSTQRDCPVGKEDFQRGGRGASLIIAVNYFSHVANSSHFQFQL